MTFGIALPPVLNEASQSVKDEVCRDVITSVTHFCATARCIVVAIALAPSHGVGAWAEVCVFLISLD